MLKRSKKSEPDPVFQKLEDVPDQITYVVYGRSGTGKTTFAGTFPKPMLYLDIRDQGTKVLKGIKGIDVDQIEEVERLEEVHRYLKRNHKKYKTVVLDTISQLQQMMVEEFLDGKVSKNQVAGDWGTMRKQDWGTVTARLKRLIIDYRDLADMGMTVAFIAQEKTTIQDEEEAGSGYVLLPEVGPSVSPSVASVLNAAVAIVCSTFIRVREIAPTKKGGKKVTKLEYCMRLGPNPVYITKVRKGKKINLPSVIVDPENDDIIAIMNGE